MKKVISILIISVLLIAGLFVLTGCGNNETTTGGSSSSSENSNDLSSWMAEFNMTNLKVPEGATVERGFIKRDTPFTDDEIDAFAQSVFENCKNSGGAYKNGWDSSANKSTRIDLESAEDAKTSDEYVWNYEDNGVSYGIRIYFGQEGNITFGKYRN